MEGPLVVFHRGWAVRYLVAAAISLFFSVSLVLLNVRIGRTDLQGLWSDFAFAVAHLCHDSVAVFWTTIVLAFMVPTAVVFLAIVYFMHFHYFRNPSPNRR